jgi:hypothetical protein
MTFAHLATAVWSLVSAVTPPEGELPRAVLVQGDAFRGRLVAADSTWQLRFETGEGQRNVPAADLVLWGQFVEPRQDAQIVLADGGLIVAPSVQIADEKIRAATPTFGKLELPLETVAGIVLRPPVDRAAGDKLRARILEPQGRDDRLLLDNGDVVAGTITAFDDEKVVLKAEGGPLEVKRAALVAVLFDPSLVDRSPAVGLRAAIGFADGSRLIARELVADAERARLKLAGGMALEAPAGSIVALQVFGGRTTYLSDLEPTSYRHIPYLQLPWTYHADRSVLGSQLRVAQQPYLKGLGMHSPARITYDVPPGARRFEAEVAIDDETHGRGSAVFRVFVDDGSGKWQPGAESEVVRGGQPPQPIAVDVSQARRISLLVDFADRGDELDHADWLGARLVK